jgi:DNA-binding NarL/FixJ family response regulator
MNFIIADSQFLTRKGIHSILLEEFEKPDIQEITNSHELMKINKANGTGILIIDPESFKLFELVELSVFRKRNPGFSLLVVTSNKQYPFLRKIIDIGIINVILKSSDRNIFIEALHASLRNRKYFDEKVQDIIMSRNTQSYEEIISLTPTEKEIVKYIAQGLTTKEIALKRILSIHTVNTHRKNIFRKLKINNSSELMMYAVKSGIIDTTEYYI